MTKEQLEIIKSLIYEVSDEESLTKEGCQHIADELKRVLYMEEAGKKRGKFNLYDYVVTGRGAIIRPMMAGVFHDNGMKIATDASIMVAIENEDPNDPNEGKIIDKNGNVITEGNFPKWQAIIPMEDRVTKIAYNSDAVNDGVARAKAESKIEGFQVYIDLGYSDAFGYTADLIAKFNKFVMAFPESNIYTTDTGILFAKSGKNVCLCMPIGLVGGKESYHLVKVA